MWFKIILILSSIFLLYSILTCQNNSVNWSTIYRDSFFITDSASAAEISGATEITGNLSLDLDSTFENVDFLKTLREIKGLLVISETESSWICRHSTNQTIFFFRRCVYGVNPKKIWFRIQEGVSSTCLRTRGNGSVSRERSRVVPRSRKIANQKENHTYGTEDYRNIMFLTIHG